jgi:hypothetical protein
VTAGALGFADARPHIVARDPPLLGTVFPFGALVLFTCAATDGSLTAGALTVLSKTGALSFSALTLVPFTGLDGSGRCCCRTIEDCSFGALLGFDSADATTLFIGFGGTELTCFPLVVLLTKEFTTPQNLFKNSEATKFRTDIRECVITLACFSYTLRKNIAMLKNTYKYMLQTVIYNIFFLL